MVITHQYSYTFNRIHSVVLAVVNYPVSRRCFWLSVLRRCTWTGFKNGSGTYLHSFLLFPFLIPREPKVIVNTLNSIAPADQTEYQEHVSHTGLYLLHIRGARGPVSNYHTIKQSKLAYLEIRHVLTFHSIYLILTL